MGKEIELKLHFPAAALAQIESHPLIAGGTPKGEPDTLINTYFDTPELDLHQRRIAVRTRVTRQGTLQTIKCAADSVGGLSSRPEWEQAYGGEFDFSPVDNPAVRDLLEREKSRLQPVFTTNFLRKTWRIAPREGVLILVMLDSGTVSSPRGEEAINELELELAQGAASDLLDFAIELAATLPLLPFDVSKAERGYRLFLGEASAPLRAGRTPVTPTMHHDAAFRALARQGQAGWQSNLLGALHSDDPEYVHQYRVALRRLETLLKIFAPALPEEFSARWRQQLRELARQTNRTRDLDVMQESIIKPLLGKGSAKEERGLQAALAACAQIRASCDTSLNEMSGGLPLLQFTRDLLTLSADGFPENQSRFAEKRLNRLHGKAVERLRDTAKTATPEKAHRLRIACKHLRYACEFFATFYDEGEMREFAKLVAELQEDLGQINDLHVALGHLDEWAASQPDIARARSFVARRHAERLEKKLRNVLLRAEALLGECRPWCGECERRGLSGLRRRLKQGITLKVT